MIGDGESSKSCPYRLAIAGQSVFAAEPAVAWHAATAACSW